VQKLSPVDLFRGKGAGHGICAAARREQLCRASQHNAFELQECVKCSQGGRLAGHARPRQPPLVEGRQIVAQLPHSQILHRKLLHRERSGVARCQPGSEIP
jgi:hypothetical protein